MHGSLLGGRRYWGGGMSNSARGFSYAVLADAHALVELIRSAYRGDVSRQGWPAKPTSSPVTA